MILIIPDVTPLIIGDIMILAIPVIHITTNMMQNICSLFLNHCFALYGKNGMMIFDPSNGGNGIRLNTPSPMLMDMAAPNIS